MFADQAYNWRGKQVRFVVVEVPSSANPVLLALDEVTKCLGCSYECKVLVDGLVVTRKNLAPDSMRYDGATVSRVNDSKWRIEFRLNQNSVELLECIDRDGSFMWRQRFPADGNGNTLWKESYF